MKKLSEKDLEKISEIAATAAENFIFSKVSKKEIVNLDVNVTLNYNDSLDVDIMIDIIFDDLSTADTNIADDAVNYAIEQVELFLKDKN